LNEKVEGFTRRGSGYVLARHERRLANEDILIRCHTK